MQEGRISYDEFEKEIESFVLLSNKIGDDWEVRIATQSFQNCPRVKYLVKKCVKECDANDEKQEHLQDAMLDELSKNENDCETVIDDTIKSCTIYEYHVVYSVSYGVPVLYLIAYKQDGCPLDLQQVWSAVPDVYQMRLNAERWTFITQQEHPILGKPFFQLHPCHTGDLMKAAYSAQNHHPSSTRAIFDCSHLLTSSIPIPFVFPYPMKREDTEKLG